MVSIQMGGGEKETLFWAGVISIVLSAAVSSLFRAWTLRDKLDVEYRHEQRKKLRELVGFYHGRLLRTSITLNYRLFNFYENHEANWLHIGGRYKTVSGYYFGTFVHRLACVFAVVRQFEKKAIYLDARIAKKNDFIFLNYMNSFQWVMTDAQLFKGLKYDSSQATDHFFSDSLRFMSEKFWIGDEPASLESMDALIKGGEIMGILKFLDGLSKTEDRLRWDRLVCLHLLLLAFINRFGYEADQAKQEKFDEIVSMINNRVILKNLDGWFEKLGLEKDREIKKIKKAIKNSEVTRSFKISVPKLVWST